MVLFVARNTTKDSSEAIVNVLLASRVQLTHKSNRNVEKKEEKDSLGLCGIVGRDRLKANCCDLWKRFCLTLNVSEKRLGLDKRLQFKYSQGIAATAELLNHSRENEDNKLSTWFLETSFASEGNRKQNIP